MAKKSIIHTLSQELIADLVAMLRWWKASANTLQFLRRRTPLLPDGGGGGCDTQNTIWDITLLGRPTGGTYRLNVTVNGVSTWITFSYNYTSSQFATQLATHSEIAGSDLSDSGGGHPDVTIRIEFIATLANTYILHPFADATNLTGGSGVGIIVAMAQKGHS